MQKETTFLKKEDSNKRNNNYFRDEITSCTFEKQDSESCISNRATSRNDREKSYDSDFIQVINSPLACPHTCLKSSHASSIDTFIE